VFSKISYVCVPFVTVADQFLLNFAYHRLINVASVQLQVYLTVNARLTLFVEILANLRHFAVEINSPNTAARDDCFPSADKASVTELASTLAKQ
jgi:hypothetical protein